MDDSEASMKPSSQSQTSKRTSGPNKGTVPGGWELRTRASIAERNKLNLFNDSQQAPSNWDTAADSQIDFRINQHIQNFNSSSNILDSSSQIPLYCICQKPDNGSLMIACDNKDCPIKWFHFDCMKLTSKPKGKWYCPQCSIDLNLSTQVKGRRPKYNLNKINHSISIDKGLYLSSSDSSTSNSSLTLSTLLRSLKSKILIIKRIPKAARLSVSHELVKILNSCSHPSPSDESWIKLLTFSYIILKAPNKNDKTTSKLSLATIIKRNIDQWTKICDLPVTEFYTNILPVKNFKKLKKIKPPDPDNIRIKKVQSKLNDADIKGAIKILSSNESLADTNEDTYFQLLSKHPSPSLPVRLPDTSHLPKDLSIIESEVKMAILSFPNGSAGGMDGLRPQHLKDLINAELGEQSLKLIQSLCTFCNFLLTDQVPPSIIPFLFGASLCGIKKKDNSIRPIAIGCTLRRLTSKIACARVVKSIGQKLRPIQLGVGTPNGAEAGAHAARRFIQHHHNNTKVFLKLDFKNAFNQLERGPMLEATSKLCPEIYHFIHQCYSNSTLLSFGDFEISSQRGCEQGDPCGPLLFSITIQDFISKLKSDMNVWYLDDGTLGGSPSIVLDDLIDVIKFSKELGLELNFSKCELMILNPSSDEETQSILSSFNKCAPGILLKTNEIDLLGAPLTNTGISSAIQSKLQKLKLMVGRLSQLNSHQAFFLLRHSFSIPMMTYLLRTTPCWHSPQDLNDYDHTLKLSIEEITNCNLDNDAWKQSTLSVKYGGLGLRNVTNLCFSSYLGSIHSATDLLNDIIPNIYNSSNDTLTSEAISEWKLLTLSEPLLHSEAKSQQKWDNVICEISSQTLLQNANSDISKARLLASQTKESGAWLNALPISSLGTLLDNQSFRIAVSLRLGIIICHPHQCICGELVSSYGTHGLSCKRSSGRKSRHDMVNDLIKRALLSCGIPSIKEPSGCSRSDGKKPDGLTLIPWTRGKPLIWDFTCGDTFAKSYLKLTSKAPGEAAKIREKDKIKKYKDLDSDYHFIPVAIETLGPWGKEAKDLIKVIGNKIKDITNEPKSTSYLFQRISIAIQRGNSASVLGTIPFSSDRLEEIFYLS